VGRPGDGLVQLTTADASCLDNSADIFVDCDNGTVTDNRSGLVWMKNASCFNGTMVWTQAMLTVMGLSSGHCGLDDGSSPGDWRLPTKEEWEAMIANATSCNPTISDDAGTGCWAEGVGSSFTGVEMSFYWSSTTNTITADASAAWVVNLTTGSVFSETKTSDGSILWAVRGGQ
jgi:hypothetical protein